LLDVVFDGLVASGFEVIGLLDVEVDELPSASDECVEFELEIGGFFGDLEFGDLGVTNEDACVDGVGFGDPSGPCGKGADADGGHDGDVIPVIVETEEGVEVIGAGGLHDDLAAVGWGELLEEFQEALEVVVDGQEGRGVGHGDIESRLGDVDADVDAGVDGVFPIS
jgi:hypothetical protein